MVEARIAVDGTDGDAESLSDWLRHEPGLRGRVGPAAAPAPDGAMGAPVELVVALATTAGGTAGVLARALSRWLIERERQRHSDVTIKVTGPGGRQVQVSARRVPDSEPLLRAVLEAADPDPAPPPARPDADPDE
ncbi:effector-associated constant component EACC1 [Actinomadura scrupuli]|uniref:effector-associated constant component EACC1 n=1 Tax=Actinomadura scrupuli TaxID=559629 RepID=UPI003D950E5D